MLKTLIRSGLAALPFKYAYWVFRLSAERLGVEAYQVRGTNGRITGPLYDTTVITTYLRDKTWSPNITSLFRDFFEQHGGGTFYDIGANIGLTTIPISQNPNVHCVAFEPDNENCSLLRANVADNCHHSNVEIIQAAVSSVNGTLRFTRNPKNSGDHRLEAGGELIVPAIRLDDKPPPKRPLAVKIDTQGAEPSIVQGGAKTLAQADLIVMEYWPWGMSRMGLEPSPILDLMTHFDKAAAVAHDEPITLVSPALALARLESLGSSEANAVDLVLARL